jgi:opacity protein-like surface antigen
MVVMKKRFLAILSLACISAAVLEASKGQYWTIEKAPSGEEELVFEPWFIGPIIAPSANVVPVGYVNIEPYLNYTIIYATYDKNWESHDLKHNIYSLNPQPGGLTVGLTSWMDIGLNTQFFWNHSDHKSATRYGDSSIGLDFQLLRSGKHWPAIKLALKEGLPTGKFQRLNPHKLGLDGVGSGSFVSTVGLDFGRVFHCWDDHYLSTRLALSYSIPARVHVHGFNFYGGGFGTNGRVHPGQSFNSVLGLEFNVTQNWVLACDFQNTYGAKTWFRGNPGVTAVGTPATVGGHSFDSVVMAPAIEYNWSEALGCIGGVIFNLAGRNTSHAATIVFAVNYFGPTSKKTKPIPYWIYPNAPLPAP